MTYLNAKKYLASLPKHLPAGTDSTLPSALTALDNPEQGLRYSCLAGSSGKSICAELLLSVYSHSPYRVGYLSTLRLDDPRRSIRMGDHDLDEATFSALTDRLRKLPVSLSASEFLLCIGLMAFRDADIDFAFLECDPHSPDLTRFLPPPLGVIICGTIPHADQKQLRGIRQCIRHGIQYIISTAQGPEAYNAISRACSAVRCGLFQPGQATVDRLSLRSSEFTYQGRPYRLGLSGRFQISNATLAIETVSRMSAMGYPVEPAVIDLGLSQLLLPCKFEILSVHPTIIADSTHSPIAVETVCRSMDDFRDKLGHTVRLCLPDGDLISPYTDALSKLGYTCSSILLLSDRTDQAPDSGIYRFSKQKELIGAALQALSDQELLLISGPHAFTASIRREILNELSF